MTRHATALRTTGAALLFALLAAPALAQGPAEQPPAEQPSPAAAVQDTASTVLTMILDSGWMGMAFMVVLGLLSLIATAVVLERLVTLRRRKSLPPAFREQLAKLIAREEDSPGAFRKLTEDHDSPAARVLRAGLVRAGRPVPEVEKGMEDAMAREVASMRSGVRPLAVIGNVAPLVGLLGTVVGMIMAFRIASQEGLGGRGESLAEGIYLALLTTAAGLMVAIPCVLLAAYFHTRIERYAREIDECLLSTIPCFDRMERVPTERHPVGRGEQLVTPDGAPAD